MDAPNDGPRPNLGVFLKAPIPGTVKTRLAATIGATAAAELYRDLARDTLDWVANADTGAAILFYTPADAAAACRELAPSGATGLRLLPQCSGDLGARMKAAFDALLELDAPGAAAARPAILVGTDCPALGPGHVAAAANALRTHDVALGPSVDGGYYLIGLRQPCPGLFADIPWSTGRVLEATLAHARAISLRAALLRAERDIDTADDLAPVAAELLRIRAAVKRGERDDFPRRTFRRLQMPPQHPTSGEASDGPGTDRPSRS